MMLTSCRLNFYELNEHECRYNFNNMVAPMCCVHVILKKRQHSIISCTVISNPLCPQSFVKSYTEEKLNTFQYRSVDFDYSK